MKKCLLSLLLVIVILSSILPLSNLKVNAANIEDDNVFLTQQTNYTCTLVSATMMVRRTAILAGLSNWESITESSMRAVAWKENAGLYYNFSYTLNGTKITVKGYENGLSGSYESRKTKLINLLDEHPEGVVIYNHSPAHAVLLTKYEESTDTFYCADPAPTVTRGQIPLSKCSLSGSGQENKITALETYWLVTSPSVSYTPITNADITNGTYYFSSFEYSTESSNYMYMKSDSNTTNTIGLTYGDPNDSSKFEIIRDGNYYLIQPTSTQKEYVLATYWKNGSSTQSGDEIALWGNDGDLSQRWIFEEYAGGYVIHPADRPSLVWTRENDKVILRPFESYTTQIWTLDCHHEFVYNHDDQNCTWVDPCATHWEECTKCGYKKAAQEHNWDSYVYTTDNTSIMYLESGHIKQCSTCGAMDLVDHNLEAFADSTYHWTECSVCNYKSEEIPHEMKFMTDSSSGYIVSLNGYHYYQCTVCNHSEKELCQFDNVCDTLCNICQSPNSLRAPNHQYASAHDNSKHWQECECGEKINEALHSYNITTDGNTTYYNCTGCEYVYTQTSSGETEVPATDSPSGNDPSNDESSSDRPSTDKPTSPSDYFVDAFKTGCGLTMNVSAMLIIAVIIISAIILKKNPSKTK